jgi:two-component system sensor histidine kinase KdpD
VRPPPATAVIPYLVALLSTSLTTAALTALERVVQIPNISLLYLPVILVVAVYFGTWPSLTAATVAVLQYDFFLLRPLFTFTIAQAQDVLAFVIFVIVAVLTGQLAAGARERAETAQRRARESATLYELGRSLMSSSDFSHILQSITRRISDVFDVERCAIFVPDDVGRLQLAASTSQVDGRRDRASDAAMAWVFERGAEVGIPDEASGARGKRRLYVPLRTAERIVGVMEVGWKRSGEPLDMDEQRLITSFAAQAALVITRAQAEEEKQRLEVVEESDRLKSALLSAVSHDLRTPLSSIKASATSLLLPEAAWTEAEGRELLQTIDREADRLNRLVGNLLDLSRIEAGVLRPVLDWYEVPEIVETLLPRLCPLLSGRNLEVDVQPGLPAVQLDLVRVETLLGNLVDNAVKYTPLQSPLTLKIWHEGGMHLALIDHGPGIPEWQRPRIFDSFYRGRQHSDREHGTGLGLAICRGIAEAHGGSIQVEDTPGGGATFVLTLPFSLLNRKAAV